MSSDPAAALVEQMLEALAPLSPPTGPYIATHALWICPCYSDDDDATGWLIWDDGDGVAWSKLPDGVSEEDIVNAQKMGGGHTSPTDFLFWLQGKPTPWPDDEYMGEPEVLEELGRQIRRVHGGTAL